MSPARVSLPTLLALVLLAACAGPTPSPKPPCPTSAPAADAAASIIGDTTAVEVRTNKGSFTIGLEPNGAPIAVANFVALAKCGFYDGISFHRVIAEFVAQAGDPQTRANRGNFGGLGSGSAGYRFEVEFPPASTTYRVYMVAMANGIDFDELTGEIQGGTDTNGSQFFVMLADADFLRPYYSVLGSVSAGTEVVDAIGAVPTSGDPGYLPLDPVIIEAMVPVGVPEAS